MTVVIKLLLRNKTFVIILSMLQCRVPLTWGRTRCVALQNETQHAQYINEITSYRDISNELTTFNSRENLHLHLYTVISVLWTQSSKYCKWLKPINMVNEKFCSWYTVYFIRCFLYFGWWCPFFMEWKCNYSKLLN